jgi:hypothetical protein
VALQEAIDRALSEKLYVFVPAGGITCIKDHRRKKQVQSQSKVPGSVDTVLDTTRVKAQA